MFDDYIQQWIGAEVTQVGDVYRVVFTLPIQIDGKWAKISVSGAGSYAKTRVKAVDRHPGLPAPGEDVQP